MRFFQETVLAFEGQGCLTWPYARNSAGYAHMQVNRKNALISRLVCLETHGEPPTPQHEAAHSCGKGHEGCVSKHHLTWKTPKENGADRIVHGTQVRANLSEAQINEIRALRGSVSQEKLAKRFGIHQTTISRIQRDSRIGQSR